MKNALRLIGILAILASTAGCQLCLLPCYACALFTVPTTQNVRQDTSGRALPEVGPVIATSDDAADVSQLPSR